MSARRHKVISKSFAFALTGFLAACGGKKAAEEAPPEESTGGVVSQAQPTGAGTSNYGTYAGGTGEAKAPVAVVVPKSNQGGAPVTLAESPAFSLDNVGIAASPKDALWPASRSFTITMPADTEGAPAVVMLPLVENGLALSPTDLSYFVVASYAKGGVEVLKAIREDNTIVATLRGSARVQVFMSAAPVTFAAAADATATATTSPTPAPVADQTYVMPVVPDPVVPTQPETIQELVAVVQPSTSPTPETAPSTEVGATTETATAPESTTSPVIESTQEPDPIFLATPPVISIAQEEVTASSTPVPETTLALQDATVSTASTPAPAATEEPVAAPTPEAAPAPAPEVVESGSSALPVEVPVAAEPVEAEVVWTQEVRQVSGNDFALVASRDPKAKKYLSTVWSDSVQQFVIPRRIRAQSYESGVNVEVTELQLRFSIGSCSYLNSQRSPKVFNFISCSTGASYGSNVTTGSLALAVVGVPSDDFVSASVDVLEFLPFEALVNYSNTDATVMSVQTAQLLALRTKLADENDAYDAAVEGIESMVKNFNAKESLDVEAKQVQGSTALQKWDDAISVVQGKMPAARASDQASLERKLALYKASRANSEAYYAKAIATLHVQYGSRKDRLAAQADARLRRHNQLVTQYNNAISKVLATIASIQAKIAAYEKQIDDAQATALTNLSAYAEQQQMNADALTAAWTEKKAAILKEIDDYKAELAPIASLKDKVSIAKVKVLNAKIVAAQKRLDAGQTEFDKKLANNTKIYDAKAAAEKEGLRRKIETLDLMIARLKS